MEVVKGWVVEEAVVVEEMEGWELTILGDWEGQGEGEGKEGVEREVEVEREGQGEAANR